MSQFQIDGAKKARVPVAKEVDLGGGVTMVFVYIPTGTFMMGSPTTEDDLGSTETQHRVTLTKGFYLGVTEVTQAQWRAVTGREPWSSQLYAKAGDSISNLGDYAWYYDNAWGVGERYSHPMGRKKPNAWGLYDMHGNVDEWCADWYGEYPSGAVTDPRGPSSGPTRVLRGGSWAIKALGFCRSADRRRYTPGSRYYSLGCRAAVDLK